jgi:hypothetical protein
MAPARPRAGAVSCSRLIGVTGKFAAVAGAKHRLAAKSSKNGRIFVVPIRHDDRTPFYRAGRDRSLSLSVGQFMDKQTKREIWLLAIGTIIVEVPVAFAAFAVLSH